MTFAVHEHLEPSTRWSCNTAVPLCGQESPRLGQQQPAAAAAAAASLDALHWRCLSQNVQLFYLVQMWPAIKVPDSKRQSGCSNNATGQVNAVLGSTIQIRPRVPAVFALLAEPLLLLLQLWLLLCI